MAVELEDLGKLKVTEETKAWLQAESHTTGRSKQEIARAALHEIALQKIRAARVLIAFVPDEGSGGDGRGNSGDGRGPSTGRR